MADLIEEVSDEENQETPEEKKGFFTTKKIIIIVVALALVGSAVPVILMLRPAKGKEPKPVYYKLDKDFNVNVDKTMATRHLRCRITLKLESDEMVAEIEEKTDELYDLIIRILQKYPLKDLDFVGQNKLRRDIENELNLELKSGKVLKVLFTEIIVI